MDGLLGGAGGGGKGADIEVTDDMGTMPSTLLAAAEEEEAPVLPLPRNDAAIPFLVRNDSFSNRLSASSSGWHFS